MPDKLLSPPPVPPDRAVDVWVDLIDTGEALIRAGFADRFGAENVEEHYRAWCKEQIADHDRRLFHLMAELSRRELGDAR